MQEIFKNTLEIVRRSRWYLEVNIIERVQNLPPKITSGSFYWRHVVT